MRRRAGGSQATSHRRRGLGRVAGVACVLSAAIALLPAGPGAIVGADPTLPDATSALGPPPAPALVLRSVAPAAVASPGIVHAHPGGGITVEQVSTRTAWTGADGSSATGSVSTGHGILTASASGHVEGLAGLPMGSDEAVIQYDLAVLADGTAVAVGSSPFMFADQGYPPGGFVGWYAPSGATERLRHLVTFDDRVGATARAVAPLDDGGALVAAYTSDSIDGTIPLDRVGFEVRTPDGDVLATLDGPGHLLRFDAAGDVVWSRPVYDITSMAVAPDGAIVLMGQTLRELSADGTTVVWRTELGAGLHAEQHTVQVLDDGDLVITLIPATSRTITTPMGSAAVEAAPDGASRRTAVRWDRDGAPPTIVTATGAASVVPELGVHGDGRMVVAVPEGPEAVVVDATGASTELPGEGLGVVALSATGQPDWIDSLPPLTSWQLPTPGFDGDGRVVVGAGLGGAAGTIRTGYFSYGAALPCTPPTLVAGGLTTPVDGVVTVRTEVRAGSCPLDPALVRGRLLDEAGLELARTHVTSAAIEPGQQGSVDVIVVVPPDTPRQVMTLELSAPFHGATARTVSVRPSATTTTTTQPTTTTTQPTTTTTQPPTTTTTAPPSPPCQPSIMSVEQGIVGAGAVFAPHLSVRVASTIPCIVGPERFDLTLDPTWDLSGLDDPWPSRVVGPGHLQWMGASAVGTTRWSGSTWYHVPLPSGPWQAGEAVASVTLTPEGGAASTASVKVGEPTYCRPSPAGIEVIPTAPYPRVRVDVTPPDPADCKPLEFEVEAVTSPRWGLGHPWFHWPREGRASRTSSPPEFELQEPRWWSGETEMTATFDTSDLIPSRSPQSATFRLGASGTATVGGRLTDGAGDPAAGVLVSAYAIGDHWRTGRHATTDADGRYTLAIPAGAPTAVRVVDPSGRFRSGWLPGQRVIALADGFIPADGSTTTIDATLVNRDSGSITGTVTVGGAPRAGLWVIVGREGHLDSTVTDADGRYRLDDVPEGRRTLLVADPTIATGWGYRRLQTQLLTLPTSVTVTAGNETVRDIRAA